MFKRKRNYCINSEKFQIIINSISSSTLYMPEFYKFLYKRKHNFILSDEELEKHMKNVSIYNNFTDYKNDKKKTNISIYYNKGHWYSIVNTIKFDAYKSKLQRAGTNNFCQSYAIYLAVNEGNISGDFNQEKYINNIQKMAELHYKFLNTINKIHYKDFYNDFKELFQEINILENIYLKPVTIYTLIDYFKELININIIAQEFAVSKEDNT